MYHIHFLYTIYIIKIIHSLACLCVSILQSDSNLRWMKVAILIFLNKRRSSCKAWRAIGMRDVGGNAQMWCMKRNSWLRWETWAQWKEEFVKTQRQVGSQDPCEHWGKGTRVSGAHTTASPCTHQWRRLIWTKYQHCSLGSPPAELKFDKIQDGVLRMGGWPRVQREIPDAKSHIDSKAQLTLPAFQQPNKMCQDQTVQLAQICWYFTQSPPN